MYIIRDGQKIELTSDDLQLLYRQEYISIAENAIECHIGSNISLDENTLAEIGEEIWETVWCDSGDIEWNVLERYGIGEEENEES